MIGSIITPNILTQTLQLLETETSFRKDSIRFELQDDNNHLLVFISIDDLPEREEVAFKQVGNLLNSLIPKRKGEYSWMVVFTKAGRVVDGYFGGDLDNPLSGL